MKPLLKLPFGLGVYKNYDVVMHKLDDETDKKRAESFEYFFLEESKANLKVIAYLETLKGSRRRAGAEKIERILRGDK